MKLKHLFIVPGLLLVLFIAVPVIRLFFASDPGTIIDTFSGDDVRASIILTLRASLWATLAALAAGIPLAYLLARWDFPFKKIVEGIIDIPVIIPHTAAGIALLALWGRNSTFTKLTGIELMGTEAAISLGMFFVSVPFLINSVKDGFRLIDERYEKTAITLGASPVKAFTTIALPLVKKPVISGSIMMWGRGISEFGAVIILAYHPMTAPILIFERFQNFGLKYAVPVTTILVGITLTIFIAMRLLEKRK